MIKCPDHQPLIIEYLVVGSKFEKFLFSCCNHMFLLIHKLIFFPHGESLNNLGEGVPVMFEMHIKANCQQLLLRLERIRNDQGWLHKKN